MPRDVNGGPRSVDVGADADEVGIRIAVDAGNQHITLTEEETAAFAVALEPVVQRWIDEVTSKGIDGTALVEKARSLIAQNSQ